MWTFRNVKVVEREKERRTVMKITQKRRDTLIAYILGHERLLKGNMPSLKKTSLKLL